MNFKKLSILVLLVICAASIFLAYPTINNNIDDPNLIVYFNTDEGGLMDLIWSYYSGEIRNSYQWDFDSGLELLYLSDFSRLILSRFMDFTPGTFVLILRWLHLIFWIGALIALWYLVGYHFEKGWQQILAVFLLAVSPAFAYFSNNLKPEPLVLFFMIIGLNYTLRIIESPVRWQNLFIAVACASIAFVVKFAGIFLLPAVIAAMYFSNRYRHNINKYKTVFPTIKMSWTAPSLLGLSMIIFPLLAIVFYARKSTGLTWYEQFGFFGSLLKNKLGLYLFLMGIFLIFLSFLIWMLAKSSNPFLKRIMRQINEINSHALFVCGAFLGFTILFGFRWIISPQHFILTYAQLGPIASGTKAVNMISKSGLWHSFLQNIIEQVKAFDPIVITLFVFYLCVEIYYRHRSLKDNLSQLLFKRLVLLVFIIPSFIFMFSMLRMAQHHMLPFFVAVSILVVQGINMFNNIFDGKKLFKNLILGSVAIFLIIDVVSNGADVIRSRMYQFNKKEDVIFDVAKWLRENIPVDTLIAADHHTRVYIPPEYKNIKIFKGYQDDRIEQLHKLVDTYHPQFIYYNEGPSGGESMPPIEEMLPNTEVRLIKSFDNKGRNYQRRDGDRFLIYKVIYY